MKSVLVSIPFLLASVNALAGTSVASFENYCSGVVQIVGTSKPHYSAGLPSQGRFPGTPEISGFSAEVKFIQLNDGCSELFAKYKLDVHDTMTVGASANASNMQETVQTAKAAFGAIIPFHFEQHFYNKFDDQLPLEPLVHEETLSFMGDGAYDLLKHIDVDSLAVYGTPSFEQLTDAQKILVAKKMVAVDYEEVKKPGWELPFAEKIAKLEPHDDFKKILYLNVLKSYLNGLDPDRVGATAFFYFNVGGSDGEALATELISLLNSVPYSEGESAKLAYDFPALLLLGYPLSPTETKGCLPISASELSTVMSNWASAPSLNYQQKKNAVDVAQSIIGGGVLGFCIEKNKTDTEIVTKAHAVVEKWSGN